jgi:FkbM family methyltransferase
MSGETKTLHVASAGLGCDVSRGQCAGSHHSVTTLAVDDVARALDLLPAEDEEGRSSGTADTFSEEGAAGGVSRGSLSQRSQGPAGKELVMVKIDVEGWEVAVLQGMRELLRRRVAQLVVFETGSTWEVRCSPFRMEWLDVGGGLCLAPLSRGFRSRTIARPRLALCCAASLQNSLTPDIGASTSARAFCIQSRRPSSTKYTTKTSSTGTSCVRQIRPGCRVPADFLPASIARRVSSRSLPPPCRWRFL